MFVGKYMGQAAQGLAESEVSCCSVVVDLSRAIDL